MKCFRLMAITALLVALAAPGVALAEPEGINTFTVSPNPQFRGQDVTVAINAAMNVDPTTNGFCLYSPTALGVTLPTTITLFQGGPGGGNRQFVYQTGNTHCDDLNPDTSDWWYLTNVTVTNRTFSGSFAVTIPLAAAPGSYDWILFLDSTSSGNDTVFYNHTVSAAPSVIYASDQANCGGYGTAGSTCFPALHIAYNQAVAYGADELVIVGTLTVDPGEEAVVTQTLTLIRAINSGQLVAGSGCTTGVPLTLAKGSLTVRGFILNGAACTGAATGIVIDTGGAVALDDLTVSNFALGTGIAFTGSGAGTLRNSRSSIVGNQTGLDDTSSGVISIGTGPADGNTFTNNQTGLRTNGGITIKGNDITGGVYGVELTGAPTAFYGNRITGASTQQVFCNGVSSGAAWNYLGGTSPASGSNCGDVDSQLGSNFVSWSDGGLVSGLGVSGSVIATFDLGNNLPFAYGNTTGRTSNYFAVYGSGASGAVSVGGTGTTQYKMFVPPNTGNVCPTGTETSCWESTTNGRAQDDTGYYYRGSLDPTAIAVSSFTASGSAHTGALWLALFAVASVLAGVWLWRRRQPAR